MAATPPTTATEAAAVVAMEGEPTQGGEPSQEALALARADETGHRIEVRAAATETETLWANPNGTLTLAVTETPIRVERADGSLVDVDTTLRTTDAGLEPVASPRMWCCQIRVAACWRRRPLGTATPASVSASPGAWVRQW